MASGATFAERFLGFALMLEIVMAAFEGPLRSLLNLFHLDFLIFVRDAVLVVAVILCVVSRVARNESCAALGIFFLLIGVHGFVSVVNLHSVVPMAYGLKLALPALCGFLACSAIYRPSRRVILAIAGIWVLVCCGAAYDKSITGDLPWVGVSVELGGIDVSLARDWHTGAIKRVGGFSRSSIGLAVMLPLLSFMLLASLRNRLILTIVCGVTLVGLVWTTQKGAILGYGFALLALVLSRPMMTLPLRLAVVFSAAMVVVAPSVLIHFDMPRDQGTFSFESFISRIEEIWPAAWHWIGRYSPLMGVGLGGIGGAQRLYAPDDFNPSDNMFLYLFANCGLMSLVYIAAVVLIALSARLRDYRRDSVVAASLVFLFGYGLVLSLLEDQIASMWFGATVGWLAGLGPDATPTGDEIGRSDDIASRRLVER